MKVLVIEDERYPTLYLDDGSWRGDPMGSEPPGHYPDEIVYAIPDRLVSRLEHAHAELRRAEDDVRKVMRQQVVPESFA